MKSIRQLVAIMFTDIVGYTALMGKDSAKALEMVRISKDIQKPLVEKHNGKWLKEMGDGALAQFSTALDAVNCSIEIQETARAKLDAKLRIGIHLGDVTVEENDVHGDGVNVAARLESIADPGGIYVSDAIEKAIRGQTEIQAKYLGEVRLKNVDYEVRTYALQGVGLPVPETKEDKELSGHFMAELNRRGVFRSTLAYLGLGTMLYLLLPLIDSVVAVPPWSSPVLVALMIVGLPISIYMSWTYERSPQGFVRTTSEKSWQNPYTSVQRKPMTGNILIGSIWLLVLALIVYPKISGSINIDSIPEGEKSIAVLPFENISGDKEQEYFSDGLSEELINALVKIPGLKVVGRTSSFAYKGKDTSLPMIGKELGVSTLLEGSVRKSGDKIRVTAQLINAEDGFHLWSETYNRQLTDIFAIQDEITTSIMAELKIFLEGNKSLVIESAETNLNAYDLYLKARQKLAARGENLTEARELFEQVNSMDPTYAPGFSGLARTLSLIPTYGTIQYEMISEPVKKAAYKALELDPDNAEAYSALGYIYSYHEWDWELGEINIMRSMDLRPKDTEIVNFLGDFYSATRNPKAIETELLALELDPLHPVKYNDVAGAYLRIGDFDNSEKYASKALQMDSSLLATARMWSVAVRAENRFDEVDKLIGSYDNLTGKSELQLMVIKASLALDKGEMTEALQLIELLESRAEIGEFSYALISNLYMQAEKYDKAAVFLEKAYEQNDQAFLRSEFITIPEQMPDDPALQAALDKPEWNELWEIRRKNLGLKD